MGASRIGAPPCVGSGTKALGADCQHSRPLRALPELDPLWLPVRVPRLGAAAPRPASPRALQCPKRPDREATWCEGGAATVRATNMTGRTVSWLGHLGQPPEVLGVRGAPLGPRGPDGPLGRPCGFLASAPRRPALPRRTPLAYIRDQAILALRSRTGLRCARVSVRDKRFRGSVSLGGCWRLSRTVMRARLPRRGSGRAERGALLHRARARPDREAPGTRANRPRGLYLVVSPTNPRRERDFPPLPRGTVVAMGGGGLAMPARSLFSQPTAWLGASP